jgi:hypothetical protein
MKSGDGWDTFMKSKSDLDKKKIVRTLRQQHPVKSNNNLTCLLKSLVNVKNS